MTGIVVIISIFFIVFFLYICVPWICGRCCRGIIRTKAVRSWVLVLTFDDGPGSYLTPAVLEILDRYNAKATFFLLGRNIKSREHIVRQIAAAGHEICSHGYNHLHQWKVSPIRAIKDIKHGWQAIDNALGTNRGRYPFRPPYGKLNLICLLYLFACRVPVFYWTLVSGDTWPAERRDSRRVAAALSSGRVGGAVVLAHDFDRANEDINKMVLETIMLALSAAKEKGMRVVTLSELVGRGREV